MEKIELNLENLSESEREQLMALVEKANKPKSKVWTPSKGEVYYYAISDGDVVYTTCNDPSGDQNRIKLGNCFPTRLEAEEAVIRQQMLTEWKRLSIETGEEENPWDDKSEHWYVYYSHRENKLSYTYARYGHDANIYFPTKESCQFAFNALGEENVRKYILNIKEV